MKRIIFILVIYVSCYGCEKEESIEPSSSLIGEWSWFSSCGGVAGCSTPQSTKRTMNLVFTIDSIHYLYRNDTLALSGRFYTYKIVSGDGKDTTNIIKMGSLSLKYSIYHDTLILSEINYNAGSAWKRIRQIHF